MLLHIMDFNFISIIPFIHFFIMFLYILSVFENKKFFKLVELMISFFIIKIYYS